MNWRVVMQILLGARHKDGSPYAAYYMLSDDFDESKAPLVGCVELFAMGEKCVWLGVNL